MNSPMSPEAYALTLSLLVKSVASNRGDEFSRTLSVNPSADPSQIKVSRERVEIGPPPRNADLVLLSHRILDSVKKFEERSRYASDDYIRELREAAR
ncbi:MAG: hypothetical protein J5I35_07675, partial [Methanothrix harundinacea]|nr:hypothetical protein [Methanothrix harundinacea]